LRRLLLACALLLSSCTLALAQTDTGPIGLERILTPPVVPGGMLTARESEFFRMVPDPPRSWAAIRDAGVVRQSFDYSCGSAALATLLSSDTMPISEDEILHEVLSGLGDAEKFHTMEEGLSLLDLKRVAESRGHRADGYRVKFDVLSQLTRPAIVFIQPGGYRHFAVLREIRGGRVFLADPARGNIRVPIWKFQQMWLGADDTGVIFLTNADVPPSLNLGAQVQPQPEILNAHELMEVGASVLRTARPGRVR
jgi:predicted double-glycine peptidase